MPYSTVAITSLASVPSEVSNFAASLGFDVSAGSGTFKHPEYADAKTFVFTYAGTGSGANRKEIVNITLDGVSTGTQQCSVYSPILNPTQGNTDASVVIPQPTMLHLFGYLDVWGSDGGSSFIAGVIEYGYNLYRHFYAGYIEKSTDFGGGEVITGSSQWISGVTSTPASRTLWRQDSGWAPKCPFSARHYHADGANGGALIVHPENPTSFRKFNTPNSTGNWNSVFGTYSNSGILGGFPDGINDGAVFAAKSAYAGAQILIPINLYITHKPGSEQYFRFVGAPAGVRLVNIEDIEPGAEVLVGSVQWKIFPVFAKDSRTSTTVDTGSTNRNYPTFNTSHYVGLAYRMN